MIEPTEADVGRRVIYTARHPGAVPEVGVITSINRRFVFVRYGESSQGVATLRINLEWETPLNSSPAKPITCCFQASRRAGTEVMDPNACLVRLLDALRDKDRLEAIGALEELTDWIMAGGFLPDDPRRLEDTL